MARVVADQDPLGFGTGPLLKVSGLWGVKTKLENEKPKGERERERERLFFLGEINHSDDFSSFCHLKKEVVYPGY